jgi:hypothetical protein
MGEDNQACRGPQGRSDATGSPASRMRSCPCDTASRLCVPTVLCSPAFRSVSSSSPSASNGRRAQRSSGFAKRRRKQLLTGGAAPRQPVSATPEIWAKSGLIDVRCTRSRRASLWDRHGATDIRSGPIGRLGGSCVWLIQSRGEPGSWRTWPAARCHLLSGAGKNLASALSDIGLSSSREVRNDRYNKEDDKDPEKDSRAFHRNAGNAAKSDGSGDERHDKEDDGVMQ